MDVRTVARAGGWAGIIGGVVGVGAAVFLIVVPPAVPDDVFNYPLDPDVFIAVQVAFFVHHLVIAFALWAFWRAGLAGTTRFATVSAISAVAVMAGLGVWEVLVLSATGLPYPAAETAWIDTGYGLLSLGCGVTLVMLGIAAARARVLVGAARWIVLISGIYVFVPMVPALFAGLVLGRVALGVWLLLFAWMGISMLRWAGAPSETRRQDSAVKVPA
ncbi:MAG: hypothetical protein ABWY53_08010 [Leifsonia flava]